jgi:hypothetical protein
MRPRRRILVAVMVVAALSSGCRMAVRGSLDGVNAFRNSQLFHQGRHGALTVQEKEWAKIAWKYFQNNYQAGTGLVASVDKGDRTTMWGAGDTIAATIAAYKLNLIGERDFSLRMTALLNFLNTMPLAGGSLPNRTYRTDSGAALNAQGTPGMEGWSAIDIGRLLVWLRIGRSELPQLAEYFDKSLLRWDMCRALDETGTLSAGVLRDGRFEKVQEGRLGYEEYAARGFQSWGFATQQASKLEPFETVSIEDVEIFYDARDERTTGVIAAVLSLPYFLDGMEYGWQEANFAAKGSREEITFRELAERVYKVQEARYLSDAILTARSDHATSGSTGIKLDTVFASGYAWNTLSQDGKHDPAAALVATQAVFPMRALWKTAYTSKLTAAIKDLYDAERGWYEGRSETTGGSEIVKTARTNAMVLESLAYQVVGPLFRDKSSLSYFDLQVANPFNAKATCLATRKPGAREEAGQ